MLTRQRCTNRVAIWSFGLRGIKFPVGQATLTPENYTLLSKVQRAIQTFDQPKVTIEGHTDSSGSTQINHELSLKRAGAVKTYLVANKTLPEKSYSGGGIWSGSTVGSEYNT